MKIKISEILFEKTTRETLVKSLNQKKTVLVNSGVLDKIKLQVPIFLKRKETNVFINSKLVLANINNGVSVKLYCNFSKIIIYSLFIGILPSLLFLVLFSNMLLFIVFSTLISCSILYDVLFKNTKNKR